MQSACTNGCTTALPAWPHLAGQTCPGGGWLRLRSLDKPTVILQQKGHFSQLSAALSFDAHGSWPRLAVLSCIPCHMRHVRLTARMTLRLT